MTRPSDELVQNRIWYLVEARGREKIARDYGVTERTVQRWITGESRPRSGRVAESISNRGRRISGPVIRGRTETGRFSSATDIRDPRAIAAFRNRQNLNQNLRNRRRAAVTAARRTGNPVLIAEAEAMPTQVTEAEFRDWSLRRERLLAGDPMVLDGRVDDWEQWRADYVNILGGSR